MYAHFFCSIPKYSLHIFSLTSFTSANGASYGNKAPLGLSAELKVAGGAGFNAKIVINNPSITGTSFKKVLDPAATFNTVNLDSNGVFTLAYKFGGLQATVTGTGGISATGTAQMGAGLTISANANLMYTGGKFSGGVVASGKVVPPFYSSTNFVITSSVNAAVTLTGTENFQLQIGTNTPLAALFSFTFPFNSNIAGTTTLSFGTSSFTGTGGGTSGTSVTLQAQQTVTISDITTANSASFKTTFATAVASYLGVSSSAVQVTGVVQTSRRAILAIGTDTINFTHNNTCSIIITSYNTSRCPFFFIHRDNGWGVIVY